MPFFCGVATELHQYFASFTTINRVFGYRQQQLWVHLLKETDEANNHTSFHAKAVPGGGYFVCAFHAATLVSCCRHTRHVLLGLPGKVGHNAELPLDEHQLTAMVHLVLLVPEQLFKARLRA